MFISAGYSYVGFMHGGIITTRLNVKGIFSFFVDMLFCTSGRSDSVLEVLI